MTRAISRILVVDDRPLVRKSLADRFQAESDLRICGQAGTPDEAMQILGVERPHMAIIGLRLGGLWGLELIRDIRTKHPSVSIFVVSMFDTYFHAASAMRAGARGFITQQEAARSIVDAVRQVLAGHMYLDAALAQVSAARLTRRNRTGYALGVDALSSRELQVFELVGSGFDTRDIAEKTKLDISTVDTYRARIKDKLQLQSASDFLRSAIAWVHFKPVN